jgi:3-methyladenine DNA glycosylase AlkD
VTGAAALRALRALGNPEMARVALRFFRTGPGEYGEGDRFIGIRVPAVRKLAREFRTLSLEDLQALLDSPLHEARLLALVVMIDQYERGDEASREATFRMYLDNTARINNWDLVDVSAPRIVGAHLREGSRAVLTRLAKSKSLWERRIAMLATHMFIRGGDTADAFRIARLLLRDEHDLIHKAAGWMLREAGKRDRAALERFLDEHAAVMPRTMLRYAIERFAPAERRRYLNSR